MQRLRVPQLPARVVRLSGACDALFVRAVQRAPGQWVSVHRDRLRRPPGNANTKRYEKTCLRLTSDTRRESADGPTPGASHRNLRVSIPQLLHRKSERLCQTLQVRQQGDVDALQRHQVSEHAQPETTCIKTGHVVNRCCLSRKQTLSKQILGYCNNQLDWKR